LRRVRTGLQASATAKSGTRAGTTARTRIDAATATANITDIGISLRRRLL
jgi:hypothetical protein